MRDLEEARALDQRDELSSLRAKFHVPEHAGEVTRYFCGNSLGLQPRNTAARIEAELEVWANLGVEGHFDGPWPWFSYHEAVAPSLARIVGARKTEIVAMNSLTVNLHLLMTSFYQPQGRRRAIVIESGAFPSDRYAAQSQVALRGHDPTDAVIEVAADADGLLHAESFEALLDARGDEIALVMLGGVNYYTGQVLEMARICEAAHRVGAVVGYDLAHAVGNVPLSLHDWDVDFAVWCSYKYLNAGPGAVGGAFVHQRHGEHVERHRLAGWWGNDPATRFEMPARFVAQEGAAGWQLSNAPVLSMASLRASLELFDDVGMRALRARALRLNDALRGAISTIPGVRVITPEEDSARGCQVSMVVPGSSAALKQRLRDRAVICDHRKPDVLRVAPVPMYNSFEDIWCFAERLREALAM